jgi:hypothetical protein
MDARDEFLVMNTNYQTTATGDGCRIAYRFDGPTNKPVLLLSNSIGTDLIMWDHTNREVHQALSGSSIRQSGPW